MPVSIKLSGRLAVVTSCLLMAGGAQAAPLSALEILQQFNLVAFGNVDSTSHVDGRAFVAGSVNGGDYGLHPQNMLPSAYAGLVVGGSAHRVNVNGGGVSIGGSLSQSNINQGPGFVVGGTHNVNFNGGPAFVGGSATSTNFNGGRLLDAPAQPATTDFEATLRSFSSQLAGLADTGSTVVINGNRASFNAVADSSGVAVFDLRSLDTAVFALGEYEFNLGGAQLMVFNVDDSIIDISANFLAGSALTMGSKAIWNFFDASSVTLRTQFGGTVLAPNATLTNFNNIEGSAVVSNLIKRGEIHLQPLSHTPVFGTPPVASVPEPGSLALVLAGCALLGGGIRSRLKSA